MQDRFLMRVYDPITKSMIYDMPLIYTQLKYIAQGFSCEDLKLMQCTGLKDKNGKLIYEGDFLKLNEYKLPVEVKRNNLGFELYRKPTRLVGYHNDKYIPEDCEVIGNIFNNPELLEEK